MRVSLYKNMEGAFVFVLHWRSGGEYHVPIEVTHEHTRMALEKAIEEQGKEEHERRLRPARRS